MLQTLELKTLTGIMECLCQRIENDFIIADNQEGNPFRRVTFTIRSYPVYNGTQTCTEAAIHLDETCLFMEDLVSDQGNPYHTQVLVIGGLLTEVFGYGISNAINTINQRAAIAPS